MQYLNQNFLKKYFNTHITPIDVNIKYECVTAYQNNSSKDLKHALENVKGNLKNDNDDVNFNTLLYTAINYFFDSIYGCTKNDLFTPHKVKDEYYKIQYIKQCFDNCNYTGFVPKQRLVSSFVNLENAIYYKECYLIIQTAYFFGTRFGYHQFLEYTEHFANTGEKLPIENYKHDVDVLEKKYNDITNDKTKHFNSISNYLYLWYYSAIELILNESSIKNNNFRQTERNGEHRIYNALAMCPRSLRYEQAFKLVLCDISSAYPTMIDNHVGSNLGSSIYDNLAKEKNISRSDSKRLFNTALNSSKYRPMNSKKREDYFKLLLDCGYTFEQVEKIVNEITDSLDFKFFDWASKKERDLIERFKKVNNINTGSRIHDALLFLYDSNFEYSSLILNIDIFKFSFEVLNEPILDRTFFNSNRYIKRKNISFLPKNIGLSNVYQEALPKDVRGSFFDIVNVNFKNNELSENLEKNYKIAINVTFYNSTYRYVHANFKTESFTKESGLIHFINDYTELKNTIIKSLRIVKTINKSFITNADLNTILNRYKKLSNLCFDVYTLATDILNTNINVLNSFEFESLIEARDYSINSSVNCDNDYAFNIALNIARSKVNDVYYLKLILDWFKDNPNTFLRCEDIGLNKYNKRLKSIVNTFNILFVCSKNYQSAQKFEEKSSTYVKALHKYRYFVDKTVRDSRNKSRNEMRISKLYKKLIDLKADEYRIEANRKIILDYFEKRDITKDEVLNKINEPAIDINEIKSILDLKETNIVTEITPDVKPIYNTDYSNSIFYHKIPKYTEFNKKALTGYNLDFYKFHQHNWNEVFEQMKRGATRITIKPKQQPIYDLFYNKAI